MTRHLTFANLAAGLALVIAVAGGGYSVAAGQLPKNSVGSKQLKPGAVKASDLAAGSVTGTAVDEASLATVPSAVTASSAATAGSATTAGSVGTAARAGAVDRVTFSPVVRLGLGQSATLATFRSLTLTLDCASADAEVPNGRLLLTTSVAGAAVDASLGRYDSAVGVGESVIVGYGEDAAPSLRQTTFSVRTADGAPWHGQGYVEATESGCSAQYVLFG